VPIACLPARLLVLPYIPAPVPWVLIQLIPYSYSVSSLTCNFPPRLLSLLSSLLFPLSSQPLLRQSFFLFSATGGTSWLDTITGEDSPSTRLGTYSGTLNRGSISTKCFACLASCCKYWYVRCMSRQTVGSPPQYQSVESSVG
jgi:hypothetical protein